MPYPGPEGTDRASTDAYPMNRLVALVMLLTIAAIVAEIVTGVLP